jgi:hypothetical protein
LRASFPEEKISKERKNIIKLTPKKREEMDNQKQKDVTVKGVKRVENAE